jgi:hypothetical protein
MSEVTDKTAQYRERAIKDVAEVFGITSEELLDRMNLPQLWANYAVDRQARVLEFEEAQRETIDALRLMVTWYGIGEDKNLAVVERGRATLAKHSPAQAEDKSNG